MNMKKCNNKRCKTCPSVHLDEQVMKLNFKVPICKTSGVIYMISCGSCNVKYIGQCSTPLNLRINNHRSLCNKNNNNVDIQSKYEYDHFQLHPFRLAKINILDIVDDHNKRLELENLYIIKHKTAYPYGLNDRVNNISVSSIIENTCIYQEVYSDLNFDNTGYVRTRSQNKNNIFINFKEFIKKNG